MEKLLLEAVSGHIQASHFGFDTVEEFWQHELANPEVYRRRDLLLERSKRQDVMYVNVGVSTIEPELGTWDLYSESVFG